MTTQEILQLLDEKRVLTAPAAVAWDEVQRQQNRLNRAAKRLNGPITVTMALNLLFAFTIFLLEQSHLMNGFLLMLGLMGGLIAFKYFVFVAPAKQALANALQADIVRSSRVSAVANVVTAYNTYRIHKDM